MKQHWIKKNNNPKLLIFVLGWACDYRYIDHLQPDGYDILSVYDYRDGFSPLDSSLSADYDSVTLFAWSFGVYVSEQITLDIKLTRSIAFNGTPYPISSQFGLAPKRVVITIRGLAKNGHTEFLRRTYGDSYKRIEQLEPRSLEHNIDELELLTKASQKAYIPHISWDLAIIGSEDVIFPPENMSSYWGLKGQVVPLPHYPFEDSRFILSLLQ